ncbi:sce7726 family protein [Pseudoalteromonas sp. KAN5]|uniref:sce7726 family protein n=1 Tax=Pseudoalteromonas sp. KAN5 TaxID=2916633 RepID=UPI001FCC357B|nr:sce7726 family protein [Pseudoalteromonas sp. KAN5]BDF95065.1 hypothetical protein KAN5_19030 [Pseudoalteromonas sp. KAN5]
MLNDKKIRTELIDRLNSSSKRPVRVVEEMAVKRGIAIADVVVAYKRPHCFEIKSDVDSLSRLINQSKIFSEVFPKVTLVTTDKHLQKAIKIVPAWWGIIVASSYEAEKVKLKYYRKSRFNPSDTTNNLLSILWNDELKSILNEIKEPYKKSLNRAELVDKVQSAVSKKRAEGIFVDTIFERKVNG